MKRRILSSLMALVLVFGLLPVSAMAASVDATIVRTSLGDAVLEKGTPRSSSYLRNINVGSIDKVTNEPGLWQRLPRNTLVGYGTVTPVNYAVPKTGSVEVSNPGVIGNCSFSLEYWTGGGYTNVPCLQFNYKALEVGTTKVTVTYYYNYGLINIPDGRTWYKETATFTVTVGEQVKPTGKPVVSNFTDEISLKCIDDSAHDASADFDDSSVTEGYSFGDIINNDGANALFPIDEFPWMCVMTFNTRAYLDAYNSVLSSNYGTHYLAENQDAEKTFTFYSRGNKKWSYDSNARPLGIDITHVEPTPEPDVPNAPNGEKIITDLGNAVKDAVKVECANETGAHPTRTYDLTAGDIGSITAPAKNSDGKYTVNVTIKADEYVKQYSTDTGVSHNLKTGAASSQTIALTYNAAGGKWKATGPAPYVTFKVEHEGIPAKPDVDTIYKDEYLDPDGNPYVGEGGSKEFAVILKCNKVTKHIYGFNSLGLVDGGYTLGDVVDNEDENTKTAYPYTCTMTVDYTKYVDQANRDYQGEDGEHEIVAGTKTTREIVWYYNRASKSWIVLAENDRAPIVIPVTCEKAPDEGMLETAVENAKLYVDCETVNSHGQQAIALNGYDKTTVTTRPYTVARTDKTATVTITKPQAYADQYKPDGHIYDSENRNNRDTFTMEWKKGEGGWNWYLKGEPALIMTKCTPKPTEDDVKTALGKLEKGVQVTCVTKKNNHGSETYAVKLGLPKNWELGGETNWNGHIGYEVETPTSSFVNLFISKHGTHTVKVGMPEMLRWVIYWDGSSWKAAAHDNPAAIEVEHVNAPDTYQVTVKNSTATNSGAGFYEADKTVTIHAGSRSNYTFIGWTTSSGVTFANAAKADTTFKMPAKAVEVTANWRYTGSDSDNDKDDDYTLKYVTNGGKVISSETKSRSWVKDYEDLPTPIRSGYRFEGWYYDTRLTDKVTDDVKVNKTVVTLYARWSSSETPGMLNDEDHFAYVQGYSDGNVHPYGLISRAETTTIFFRLLTDEARDEYLTETSPFADVASDAWYATAVATMEAMGIVEGRAPAVFDPEAPITRGEFAAIAARFDSAPYDGADRFTDIGGHWAAEYINQAAVKGWVEGQPDGSFAPDRSITRAEAMTTINRVLGRLPETADDLLDDMIAWPDNPPGAWYYLAVQEATNSHDYGRKADTVHETWTGLQPVEDWTRYEQ